MATKTNKCTVEVLLVGAELSGFPDRMLPVSRNLGTVDLIWPKVGTARKSAAPLGACRRSAP